MPKRKPPQNQKISCFYGTDTYKLTVAGWHRPNYFKLCFPADESECEKDILANPRAIVSPNSSATIRYNLEKERRGRIKSDPHFARTNASSPFLYNLALTDVGSVFV